MAESILELVIDGPEADMAYSSYVADDAPKAKQTEVIEIEEDEADMEASQFLVHESCLTLAAPERS